MEQSYEMEDRFEALQDEVNLLKNEIKQTLVDLREYMMKERTILPQEAPLLAAPRAPVLEPAAEMQQPGVPPSLPGLPLPPGSPVRRPGPPLRDLQTEPHASGALDAVMVGNIIWWLGTAKRRGLTLQQVTPYLEAYEWSGHLTPAMVKLILRSMAELDDRENIPADRAFSPHDYAEALLQLHDIICTPGYVVDRLITAPERPGPPPGAPPSRGDYQDSAS